MAKSKEEVLKKNVKYEADSIKVLKGLDAVKKKTRHVYRGYGRWIWPSSHGL